MKKKLKKILKNNRLLYYIYFIFMSIFINFIKFFVRTDDKLILFVSFGGRKCNDSPRAIYDFMKEDPRFSDYKLVWGVVDIDDFEDIDNKVKIDTLKYYVTALKARCWITNVLIERSLKFSGKNTFYLYTGHGSPIKKVGNDENRKKHFKSASKSHFDACLAQSEHEKEIRARVLSIQNENSHLTGIPANDLLANYSEDYLRKVKLELNIPVGKKVILYAPTFREYNKIGLFETTYIDFEKWKQELGNDYILLYRAHPITEQLPSYFNDFVIDVSNYNSIEPLLIASDILVSDFSGLIADYSILHRPIYLFVFDYDKYVKNRGLYLDLKNLLPCSESEDELLELIKGGYNEIQKKQVCEFQKKYATYFGNGTKNAVDLIYKNISK